MGDTESITEPVTEDGRTREQLYAEAAAEFGAALSRLARAYEADAEKRRDLLQELHLALWRSFEGFDGRCSVRTWVYRVAHNAAASWVGQQKRHRREAPVSLEELESFPTPRDAEAGLNDQHALDRLTQLIQRLQPVDRQVILSYLEGLDAASTGEVTGLSARNIATKIHRIKVILSRQFHEGGRHGE